MQERGEDPPGLPELVRADKVHLGAQEHVKDQALIGVGKARALQEGKFKYLICACKKKCWKLCQLSYRPKFVSPITLTAYLVL